MTHIDEPQENDASQPSPPEIGKDATKRTSLLPEGYLHPSSLVFEALAQIRQFLLPAFFGLAGIASGNYWGIYVAIMVVGLSVLINLIRFLTLRYKIEDSDFVVTEGLLFRRVRSVPIRRIQNIDYVQNPLHRLFHVAVVNVETASGDKPEATLRVITMHQVDQLRAAVKAANQATGGKDASQQPYTHAAEYAPYDTPEQSENLDARNVTAADVGARNDAGEEQATLWAIPAKLLFIAGLTSNRGIVLLGVVVGYFFQSGWEDRVDWRSWRTAGSEYSGFIPEFFFQLSGYLQAIIVVVSALALLRILGIAWYFLRFYDYRLTLCDDDLRISCGLFTKVNATVPRGRIQFISIHRPLLMRPFGLASVRIETAGGGGNSSEDASNTVSRRWFIPVIPHQQALDLLSSLRTDIDWQPDEIHWQPLSPRARSRMLRLGLAASLIVALIGLAAYRPWGPIAGLLTLPFFALLAHKRAASKKYSRPSWGIVFQSGVLNKKMSMTFLDRVQTIDISQSYFDRRWDMATLRIDTAAAGPASHVIDVAFLDRQFAMDEFAQVTLACAKTQPEFG